LKITQRAYILSDGAILKEGSPEMLAQDELVRKTYLGDQFKLD
jgi:lipopolysaccharide export system ATP-binding protein